MLARNNNKRIVNDCPVQGWKRIICRRKSGKTAGKLDVYYTNPEGGRLRSTPDVAKYLKIKGLELPLSLFNFCGSREGKECGFTRVAPNDCKSSEYFLNQDKKQNLDKHGKSPLQIPSHTFGLSSATSTKVNQDTELQDEQAPTLPKITSDGGGTHCTSMVICDHVNSGDQHVLGAHPDSTSCSEKDPCHMQATAMDRKCTMSEDMMSDDDNQTTNQTDGSTMQSSWPQPSHSNNKSIVNDCPVQGWKRIISRRKSGKTAGKLDVYYMDPEGGRLRSTPHVARYLKIKGLELPLSLFNFFGSTKGKKEGVLTRVRPNNCKSSEYFISQDRKQSLDERGKSPLQIPSHNVGLSSASPTKVNQDTELQDEQVPTLPKITSDGDGTHCTNMVVCDHVNSGDQHVVPGTHPDSTNCSEKAPCHMQSTAKDKKSNMSEDMMSDVDNQDTKLQDEQVPTLPKITSDGDGTHCTNMIVCDHVNSGDQHVVLGTHPDSTNCSEKDPCHMQATAMDKKSNMSEAMMSDDDTQTTSHIDGGVMQSSRPQFGTKPDGVDIDDCVTAKSPANSSFGDESSVSMCDVKDDEINTMSTTVNKLSSVSETDIDTYQVNVTSLVSRSNITLDSKSEHSSLVTDKQHNATQSLAHNVDTKKRKSKTSCYFKKESITVLDNEDCSKRIKKPAVNTCPGLTRFYELKYCPPQSPFNLIQEELYQDPWKLLVATIFLNKTNSKNAIPTLWKFFDVFPSPVCASKADPSEISKIIQPLGLFRKRAQILIRFSKEYLTKMWEYPSELYGIGKYGNDSFRIFCLGEYQDVLPDDHKLNLYHNWICERDRQNTLIHCNT